MKEFVLLKDFIDYIPNCICCGRPLNTVISNPLFKNIALYCEDDLILSREKKGTTQEKYRVVIHSDSNFILTKTDRINNKYIRYGSTIYKCCKKCNFNILGKYFYNEGDYFPSLYLLEESFKGVIFNKNFFIMNNYEIPFMSFRQKDYLELNVDKTTSFLDFNFDFTKISSKSNLLQKVSTLLTFQ